MFKTGLNPALEEVNNHFNYLEDKLEALEKELKLYSNLLFCLDRVCKGVIKEQGRDFLDGIIKNADLLPEEIEKLNKYILNDCTDNQ